MLANLYNLLLMTTPAGAEAPSGPSGWAVDAALQEALIPLIDQAITFPHYLKTATGAMVDEAKKLANPKDMILFATSDVPSQAATWTKALVNAYTTAVSCDVEYLRELPHHGKVKTRLDRLAQYLETVSYTHLTLPTNREV